MHDDPYNIPMDLAYVATIIVSQSDALGPGLRVRGGGARETGQIALGLEHCKRHEHCTRSRRTVAGLCAAGGNNRHCILPQRRPHLVFMLSRTNCQTS